MPFEWKNCTKSPRKSFSGYTNIKDNEYEAPGKSCSKFSSQLASGIENLHYNIYMQEGILYISGKYGESSSQSTSHKTVLSK